MQVKIIIGTIAFMLTMILLGFYSLLEPARLQNFTDARNGRQIEAGAELYKSNCATCHGLDGKGTNSTECYNAEGDPIGCVGRPLNSYGLLCVADGAAKPQRLEDWQWAGTTEGFIHQTVAAGRSGGVMAAWGQEYGGPLQENEVTNVVKYVANFANEELCSIPLFAFPWTENLAELSSVTAEEVEPTILEGQIFDLAQLPVSLEGDPATGKTLYEETYACNSCHGLPEDSSTAGGSGPWHGDYAERVGDRIGEANADGTYTYESIEDYSYRSILYPGEYLVGLNGQNSQAESTDNYANAMIAYSNDATMNASPEDIVHLIAYLLESK